MSYNRLEDISNIFQTERVNEGIETLDVSNNKLTKVPMNIWKWQRIHSLNLENNNIRNFAPEIGYLNLKNLAIGGNPSMLIKNRVSKNTVSLLDYLRDRLPANNTDMEYEVAEI